MIKNDQRLCYPHFADTHSRLEMFSLRKICGPGAYSVYQSLNELLSRQEDFCVPLQYERLALMIGCNLDVIKSVINNFDLFVFNEDGTRFTSVEMKNFTDLMRKSGRRFSKNRFPMPYFKHYCDASKDAGFVRLFADHGHEGTEVYWMLKEFLCDCEDYSYPFDCKALSFLIDCKEDLIRTVICDYGLFELVNDGTAFRSPDLDEQMAQMEEDDKKYSAAGRKAALARHHRFDNA